MEKSEQRIVLGVDLGSTKIQVGAVTREGEILKTMRFGTFRNTQQETIDSLVNAISGFLDVWEGRHPDAIGIGLVGHIDQVNGIWMHSLNAKISEPVAIASILSERFKAPVYIDNDVNCAALAELCFGIGKTSDHFILVNVGTGVGCGIVDGGRIVRGVSNSAGEMGHMSVETGGDLCPCGFFGCLESIVGGAAIIRSAVSMLPGYPDSALNALHADGNLHSNSIFDAARAGDALAIKITQRCVKALGVGIVNIANLLNPEYVVFTGSVMGNDWFVEQVRKFVSDNLLIFTLNCLKGMVPSFMHVGDVGMYGAACLCLGSGAECAAR